MPSAFRTLQNLLPVAGLASVSFLAGCSQQQRTPNAVSPATTSAHATVHGGQQPVSGAAVQLYAVGNVGDGSPSTPLFTTPVLTDAGGGFDLTGKYTCPTPSTLVYILATGGNPGLAPGTSNPQLALMAAIGACSSLTPSTYIAVNELTTVAATGTLAPFSKSATAIGSSPADLPALQAAFTAASQLVDIATGNTPGTDVPAGAAVPVEQINTLADILAACINSLGGVAGDNSSCGNLLALATTPGLPTPTDTIGAALSIANNPTQNIAALLALPSPQAPFQPQLTSPPPDFAIRLIISSALSLSTTALDFGPSLLNFSPAPQSFTLTNTGPAALSIGGVRIIGSDLADFSQTSTCRSSLAPLASCNIQVAFTPSTPGLKQAFVSVTSSAANSPQAVSLSGVGLTGTAGPVTLSPSSLSFSPIIGIPQPVTLANNGSTPLLIQSISIVYPPTNTFIFPIFSETNDCGSILAAGATCTINVTWNLTGSNTGQSATLKVTDSTPEGAQTVALTGQTSYIYSFPFAIDFGSFSVGSTSSSQVFYVSSPNPLDVTATLTGPNASDFSLPSGPGCSIPHSPITGGCGIPVVFTPSGLGPRSAVLSTNVGNIPLTGIGVPIGPAFFLQPSTIDFGQVALDGSTRSSTVTLTNGGTTSINPAFSLSGPDASNFSLTTDCTPPLAHADYCHVTIQYDNSDVGSHTATLINTDSASGVVQTATVSARSVYSAPTPNLAILNFPAVTAGTTSAPQTITTPSPAGHPVLAQLATGTLFQLTNGFVCPGGPEPCAFSLTFSPTSLDSVHETLTLTDTATGSVSLVQLYGTGSTPAAWTVSSTSIEFPFTHVGSVSAPMTVSLLSSGSQPFLVSGVAVTGDNPADFQLTDGCTGVSVAPGQSCTLSVTFSPSAVALSDAKLQITSNTSSFSVIPVAGIGLAP